MPIYEFKCKECGTHVDDTSREVMGACRECGGPLKRVFSVHLPSSTQHFRPHYNFTVGSYVSSWSDFSDKLRIHGEHNEEVTGIPTLYTPLHPADIKRESMNVTGEGVDSALYDPNTTNRKVIT